MHTFVLLPSVLLGAESMKPLARELRKLGLPALIADTAGAESPEQVTLTYQVAAPDGPAAWVAHSNAGLYLARILRHRPGDVGIFLDASVPGTDRPQVSVAGTHRGALEELTDDSSRVPPWTDWWAADQLEELVPASEQRKRLRASCPSLPLAYFSQEIEVPDDWPTIPAAYASFDGAYAAERERLADLGWPTRHLPGHHLTPFTNPRTVAPVLVELPTLLWPRAGAGTG